MVKNMCFLPLLNSCSSQRVKSCLHNFGFMKFCRTGINLKGRLQKNSTNIWRMKETTIWINHFIEILIHFKPSCGSHWISWCVKIVALFKRNIYIFEEEKMPYFTCHVSCVACHQHIIFCREIQLDSCRHLNLSIESAWGPIQWTEWGIVNQKSGYPTNRVIKRSLNCANNLIFY